MRSISTKRVTKKLKNKCYPAKQPDPDCGVNPWMVRQISMITAVARWTRIWMLLLK